MPSITVTTEQLTELSSQLASLQSAIATLIAQQEEPIPEPEPVEPTPEPAPVDPPPTQSVTFDLYDAAGKEWEGGVSVQMNRIIVRANEKSRAAFKPSAPITLNQYERKVVKVIDGGASNVLYVEYDGDRMDPAKAGTKVTVQTSVEAEPEGELLAPASESIQLPSTKRKGIVCTNLGMGQGAPDRGVGTQDTDFNFPEESEIIRGKGYGFTRYRVGGLFERFFKKQGSTEMYLGNDAKGKEYSAASVIRVGQQCKKHGCTVLWNPFHNYGTVFEIGRAHV